MKIFTPLFGHEKYFDWFRRGLCASLDWTLNKEAIKGAEWIIATDRPTEIPAGYTIIRPPRDGMKGPEFLQYSLVQTIEMCLVAKEPMLMACPDFIFQDGTISALKSLSLPGLCVGFAHMRVTPDILDRSVNLIDLELAWDFKHDSWKYAEAGLEKNNSRSGGVCWRRTGNIILVQHRLPSTFLANFLPEDLEYFKSERFDAWDHRWPSTWKGNRQRLIGSSDAAFMAELTDPRSNVPAMGIFNPAEPDAYHADLPHLQTNRQFVSVFRV